VDVNPALVRAKTYRRRTRRWCETCKKQALQVETRTEDDVPDWGCTSCGNVTWPEQVNPHQVTPAEIRTVWWNLGGANPAEFKAWLKAHGEGP
jgi:hypothetical protein